MFTIATIKAAHAKVKTGADFPAYIQDLKSLGVTHYETYVTDGHTRYHQGEASYEQLSEPKYEALPIAAKANDIQFKTSLVNHQQGQSDYKQFCEECAENGVEKWAVNLEDMTCTYFDQSGNEMLVENIPG